MARMMSSVAPAVEVLALIAGYATVSPTPMAYLFRREHFQSAAVGSHRISECVRRCEGSTNLK